MKFTHNGEQLDSDLLMFTPEQKAFLDNRENEILELKQTILTLEFKLREQVMETREKILEDKL